MRRPSLICLAVPGCTWAFLVPLPLWHQSAAPSEGRATSSASHPRRCRPLCRKGFSKGGLGKQGELMALMAQAQRDRAKKELEDKLRESGDLQDGARGEDEPTPAAGGRITAERSWRNNDGADDATRDTREAAGLRVEVWPAVSPEGRESDEYREYERLLDDTADHSSGARAWPETVATDAAYQEYDALREKAKWEAAISGKRTKAGNRSPVASEGDYENFEAMLTHGVSTVSQKPAAGPKVAAQRALQEAQKNLPPFAAGEFAPLDVWRALRDTEGSKTNFGLYRGTKPLLVVADPRAASGEMREALRELNTRMPRKLADVVAITPDAPGTNRKTVKKIRITFPVLSDESGDWMHAYRVTHGGRQDKMAFLIEPDLGTILHVLSDFDALSLVDVVRDVLAT